MALTVKGRIKEIYLVRMEPGADLFNSIQEAIAENHIETGVIMDVTGTLTKARIQKFQRVGDWRTVPIDVVELPGPFESSGHGIIGVTKGTGGGFGGGIGEHRDGEPYFHCHIVLTSAEQTVCGHLMPGCIVRSHHEKSHFTVVLAAFEGVRLDLVVDPGARIEAQGTAIVSGGVYHELTQL